MECLIASVSVMMKQIKRTAHGLRLRKVLKIVITKITVPYAQMGGGWYKIKLVIISIKNRTLMPV